MAKNRQGTGKRRGAGRPFPPGNRANPSGRPKKDFDLVTRCRELTPDIIERYGKLGKGAKSAAEVQAGKVVIEYGYDKPKQRTELTGKDGAPIGIVADSTVLGVLKKLAGE
jgi:hypothetical protein